MNQEKFVPGDGSQRRWWQAPPLVIALCVTVLYLLGLLWLLGPYELYQGVLELNPNEFGDFLAGVFAPVAFLWLATAVLIQAQELSAQREELAQTRLEVRQNREVAMAQAEEARKTSEYIGQQTAILIEQQRSREAAEAEILLRKKLASLFLYGSSNSQLLANIKRPGGGSEQFRFNISCRDEAHLRRLAPVLRQSIATKGHGAVELRRPEVLLEYLRRLGELEEISTRLKEADRVEYQDMRVNDAIDVLRELARIAEVDLTPRVLAEGQEAIA